MHVQIRTERRAAGRRAAGTAALAAAVVLGVTVGVSPASASSESATTHVASATSSGGPVLTSDRQRPQGRIFIPAAYFDPQYPDGPKAAAADMCQQHGLGNQCLASVYDILSGRFGRQPDCEIGTASTR